MAQGLNRATLMGRMGGDPEVRFTPAGKAVASFSVATTESWKDAQGQKQERTDWHDVTAWGKTAEWIGENVHKGSLVYVEGRMQTEKWPDKKYPDVTHRTTRIVCDRFDLLREPRTSQQDPGRPEFNRGDAGGEMRAPPAPSNADIPF